MFWARTPQRYDAASSGAHSLNDSTLSVGRRLRGQHRLPLASGEVPALIYGELYGDVLVLCHPPRLRRRILAFGSVGVLGVLRM